MTTSVYIKGVLLLILVAADLALSATTTTSEKPTTVAPKRRLQSFKTQRDLQQRPSPRTGLQKFVGRLFSDKGCNKTGSVIDLSFITDAISGFDDFLAQLQNSTSDGGLTDLVSTVGVGGFKLIKFIVPKLFIVGGIIAAAVAIGTAFFPSKYKPEEYGVVDWMDNMVGYVFNAIDNMSNKYGGKFGSQQDNGYSSGWSYSMDSAQDWNKRRQSDMNMGQGTYSQPYPQQQAQQQQQAYPGYSYMSTSQQQQQPQQASAVKFRRQGSTEITDSSNMFAAEATNEVRSLKTK